ncbi:MAG: EAL domain-containing protein [Deltaproteobacteria bacterium]|nr:EAL domain-containing protein [Deltaproteobacteria bacterium]
MNSEHKDNSPWLNTLAGLVGSAGLPQQHQEFGQIDDCCVRIAIVARIRWFMLAAIALYSLFALTSYSISSVVFVFSSKQVGILTLTVLSVVVYNFVLSSHCQSLIHFTYLIHILIALDLLVVTTLVHFTGGVVSWFWPVYLLVTIESAFLFEDKRDVWLIGSLGAILYGVLLALENQGILWPIAMPFIDSSLHESFLFQLLMWLWVAGINATVAIIAAFLMETIRRDHSRIKESDDALLGFISAANDLIFCADSSGKILYANLMFQKLVYHDSDNTNKRTLYAMVNSDAGATIKKLVAKVLQEGNPEHLEVTFVADQDQPIEVEMSLSAGKHDGDAPVVWGVCRDITERKRAQSELFKMAHHDVLTGLPNRILLEDRMFQAKALAKRTKKGFALLFLDLDRFKIINDTLGHAIGDELLQLVAGRLKRSLRETDTVARIGGDEFIILLSSTSGRTDISNLSEKLIGSLSLPFHINEHELFVTASIGICIFPDDADDLDEMMKKSDIAMYHAKALGRNNFQFYNDQMDQNASRHFVISNSLRRGLEHDEFRLYYQPKIDVVSGRIVAIEALARWEHPELGLLSPAEFIQLAEENGLIVQLGEWVLRESCLQNMRWQEAGITGLRMAVNLSGYQLQHNSILPTIRVVLAETGMAPENLELEITESVIMQDPDLAVSVLSEISDLGIHISIDDFGTGYSSLSHLKRFSVNTIKIDKSFVMDVDMENPDSAVTAAIIAMGNSLNLNVIAEGVETQAQYDFLKVHNCGQAQGFLFSHPLPPDEIVKVLWQNIRDTENQP